MKKDKQLINFMEGVEMTILPQEDQILLDSMGGFHPSLELNKGCTYNNCHGGNCVEGCSC